VVVQCGSPEPDKPTINGYYSDSEIKIVSVLKGANNITSAELQTDYDLQSGRYYLVFGSLNGGTYTSYGPYAVIPLGHWFSADSIAGKTSDQQIQILLKRGLEIVSKELQHAQQQKQQLEAGLHP